MDLERVDLDDRVHSTFPHRQHLVTDVQDAFLLIEAGRAELRDVHVFVHILNRLKFLESESVPEGHRAILADRNDLLLLLKNKHVEDILPFGDFGLVSHAEGMRVDREHETFGTARYHNTKR